MRAVKTATYRDRTGRGWVIRRGDVVPAGLMTDAEWRAQQEPVETRMEPAPSENRARRRKSSSIDGGAVEVD